VSAHPYARLTPDLVLDAVDGVGLRTDGRLLGLNSFENRVYQLGIEENVPGAVGATVVAKFYRPERWSDTAILEEHAFTAELAAREIPAVPPLSLNGATLHHHVGFRFAVFPRQGGRPPELDQPGVLEWLGRFLGRIHAVGAVEAFHDRPALDIASFGEEPRAWLLAHDFIPPELRGVWAGVSAQALAGIRHGFERAGTVRAIRLHGDCHIGNVLWTTAGPHFVDFDDARMGPAVQDIWMLLSGEREDRTRQLHAILAGYEDFAEFDTAELHLVEALRTLRLIHYSAWIARRWQDPAFPLAFPWFDTPRYWEERILELREQIALMDEPALPA
jgi:Ser/Thr protein kinase RdoA (MazF antagonist)